MSRNKFIFDDTICKIELKNRSHVVVGIAIIDVDMYEQVSKYTWCLNNGYVWSTSYKKKYLHKLILPEPVMIDHINRDKLDCRQKNLRSCTYSTNRVNAKLNKNNTSGYFGVSRTSSGKWRAMIQKDKVNRCLGSFDSKIEAAKVYDKEAIKLFGEFATLNFGGKDE